MAVARTLIANCPEFARACPGARGKAIVGGAFCASACPLILAGGVERLIGPLPNVGVHQITTVAKETEGVEHLTTVKKIYEQDSVDRVVQSYLHAMGVQDPVMEILRKTPAASIRWLSPDELRESHLTTGALDASAPILVGGLNGLDSRPLAGGGTGADIITGRVLRAVRRADAGRRHDGGSDLRLFAGAAEWSGASVAARDGDKTAADPSPDGWTLTLTAAGQPGQWKAGGRSRAQAMIPREQFCALARGGALAAAPAGALAEGEPPQPPVTFDLAATGGAGPVVAEACP